MSYFLAAGRAEIADGDVHHAVVQAQLVGDLALDREQVLVLVPRAVGMAEREHLDLLELVRAEDAARVLAGRARLAPEAGREPAVAQREICLGEDLAHVQRRQGDLRGADQEQLGIGVGDGVDLLARLGEEARADERLLAHEHRRHDGREALADQLVERVLHGRDVQPHEVAEQIGEARAGRAGAALHVDHRAGEVDVVARLEVELRLRAARQRVHRGVLLEHAVGGATRAGCSGASSIAVSKRGVGLAQRDLELRQAVAQPGRRRDLGRRVAPGALGLADRLRGVVALGAQLVDLGLQRAPALVEREHLVEQAVGLAPRERCAHALGVGADDPDVEHALRA